MDTGVKSWKRAKILQVSDRQNSPTESLVVYFFLIQQMTGRSTDMLVFNQGLDGFLHALMPSRLQASLKTNTATYIRARSLTAMLLVSTFITAITTLLSGTIHWLLHPELLGQDLISLAVMLMVLLQTLMFYKYNNHWISGLAFTNFYFLVALIWVILSGGYDSPSKSILLTCPMMSFLIGGRQEGIQNTVAVMVVYLVMVFLHTIEFELPNLFETENPQLMFGANWITAIIVIASSLLVYEVELQKRGERLNARQDPTRRNRSETSKKLQALIHRLIPLALRNSLDTASITYTRVRILSAVLVIAAALSFLHTLAVVAIHMLFDPSQLKYDSIIFSVTLCFVLQIWIFHKFHRYTLSGLLLSYFYFFMIVILVAISGGYDSPMIILLLISPMIFFMVGGIIDGTVNAVLVAMIGAAFSYLKEVGYVFISFFQGLSIVTTSTIAWSIAIISVAACMMTYDTELEKLE